MLELVGTTILPAFGSPYPMVLPCFSSLDDDILPFINLGLVIDAPDLSWRSSIFGMSGSFAMELPQWEQQIQTGYSGRHSDHDEQVQYSPFSYFLIKSWTI